jgi:outer membrane protein assembly factor BamE (lipoprotein component of BamABCDE complex)
MANRSPPTLRRAGRWAILAGLAGAACTPQVSNHGYRFDQAALAQIQPGRTSEDQVLALLGSPSSRTAFGSSVWYYVSQRTERLSFYQEKVVNQDVVAIAFDDLGRVSGVERSGLDEARQVSFVDRETPTSGSELTALEQFIGNIGRFNPEADADQP